MKKIKLVGIFLFSLGFSVSLEAQWARTYGGSSEDRARAIQQTLDGNYVVAGNTNSFASDVTRFGRDVMVIKLSPSGILSAECDLKRAQDTEIAETNADKKDTSVSPRETTVQPQDMVISFGNYDISDVVMNDFCRGQYILCLQSVEDGLTEPPSGIHWYEPGTTVTIKAIAYDKHKFIGWWGDALGSVNPITITMDSHKSIRPGFTGLGGGGINFGDFDVGPCFIASAAYESSTHHHIVTLRAFRDRYLIQNAYGCMIICCYYRYSPSIARFIARHKALKKVVRIILIPVVSFSYLTLNLDLVFIGVAVCLVYGLALACALLHRKKRKKALDKKKDESLSSFSILIRKARL